MIFLFSKHAYGKKNFVEKYKWLGVKKYYFYKKKKENVCVSLAK